jgi:vancomycin resistance protein YoaR
MKRRDIKNLKFRYLLWLYKTTKEAFDRTERKFTQVDIDKKIMRSMKEHFSSRNVKRKNEARKLLKDFKEYIDKKEKEGRELKFEGQKLSPEYYHLSLKLEAIEETIAEELGRSGLREIKALYEREMMRRIIEVQDHK